MRILITGGAGYIGSTLCEYLLNSGHEVTVLDSFLFSNDSLNSYMSDKNFSVFQEDVRNISSIKNYISKNDVIIPLACLVGAPLCNLKKVEAEQVNYESIKSMIDIMSKNQYIIYPTTNSGYGVGEKDKFCTEETPLNPISVYGKTKVKAENYIANNFENSTRLRLATVFGCSPRMRLDLLVNDFVYRATKDKFIVLFESHFKRNYIHIRDVCRAILMSIEDQKNFAGETFNLGLSDANLSKLELCLEIKKYIPQFEILESDIGKDIDKRDYIVSNEKIESRGFKPIYSIDDGVNELIKLFKYLIPSESMRNF
tara:strand:- start:2839 stop:3777 length:939 start_codon:yes stop_codon:yes gene_type:complete